MNICYVNFEHRLPFMMVTLNPKPLTKRFRRIYFIYEKKNNSYGHKSLMTQYTTHQKLFIALLHNIIVHYIYLANLLSGTTQTFSKRVEAGPE